MCMPVSPRAHFHLHGFMPTGDNLKHQTLILSRQSSLDTILCRQPTPGRAATSKELNSVL